MEDSLAHGIQHEGSNNSLSVYRLMRLLALTDATVQHGTEEPEIAESHPITLSRGGDEHISR